MPIIVSSFLQRKGLHPLHVAAALPGPAGPRITELLLHAVTDPDARACDQNEICERDTVCVFLSFKPETLVVIFKVRVELERKGFQSQMFCVVVFLQFVMKAQESVNTSKNPQLKEGGRTALHMACQRDSDYRVSTCCTSTLMNHDAINSSNLYRAADMINNHIEYIYPVPQNIKESMLQTQIHCFLKYIVIYFLNDMIYNAK